MSDLGAGGEHFKAGWQTATPVYSITDGAWQRGVRAELMAWIQANLADLWKKY